MNPSDRVRADMFGRGWSPTGWPGGQNHNSWGRNSSGLVQKEKVRGGPGGLCCQTLEAMLAKWLVHEPTDHKGTFQTFYPPTVTSWWVYRGQMSSSQPVWQKGGCQKPIFWYHCSFPLPDPLWFELWWITLYESLWSSSIWKLPDVYLDSDVRLRKNIFRHCRAFSACSFKVRSSEL